MVVVVVVVVVVSLSIVRVGCDALRRLLIVFAAQVEASK